MKSKIFTCPYIKQSEYFDVKCLQMQGAICADKRDFQKMCARKYKVCKQNVNMNRIVHIRGVCDQKIIPTQERQHCLIASHSSQRLNILQCRWHNTEHVLTFLARWVKPWVLKNWFSLNIMSLNLNWFPFNLNHIAPLLLVQCSSIWLGVGARGTMNSLWCKYDKY